MWSTSSSTITMKNSFSIKKVLLIDDLNHKLLCISKLCDKSFNVKILKIKWILDLHNKLIIGKVIINNIYMIDLDKLDSLLDVYLKITLDECKFWHRKLYHASMHTLRMIIWIYLFSSVPKLDYSNEHLCDSCMHKK